MQTVPTERSKLQTTALVTDILIESLFLYASLRTYWLYGKRCENLTAPYTGHSPQFPQTIANGIVANDCNVSSGDLTILMMKLGCLVLKIIFKLVLKAGQQYYSTPGSHTNDRMQPLTQAQSTAPPETPNIPVLAHYPAAIFQALALTNLVLFPSLLFSSWIPTFNQFNNATQHCPNFIETGLDVITQHQKQSTCDLNAFQWQKFSWAKPFLILVIANLVQLQISKIIIDLIRLTQANQNLNNRAQCVKPFFKKLTKTAAPLLSIAFLIEVPLITTIFVLSCSQYPGGLTQLLTDITTTGLNRVDKNGQVKFALYQLDLHLITIDQKNFYAITVMQIFALPFTLAASLIGYTFNHYRISEPLKNLNINLSHFTHLASLIGILIPCITTLIFTISAILVTPIEPCYLDNFLNVFNPLFSTKSFHVITGNNQACSLPTLATSQGTTMLMTVLLTESLILIPSSALILVSLLSLLLPKAAQPSYIKYLSLFNKPEPVTPSTPPPATPPPEHKIP